MSLVTSPVFLLNQHQGPIDRHNTTGGQMAQLLVKCKNCGFELPAATQMNEEAFMAIDFEYNNESCHKCKGTFAYNKSDYYFK